MEKKVYDKFIINLFSQHILRFIESQPLYVNLVSPPAQYFFHKIYIWVAQLILIECPSYRFSVIVLE